MYIVIEHLYIDDRAVVQPFVEGYETLNEAHEAIREQHADYECPDDLVWIGEDEISPPKLAYSGTGGDRVTWEIHGIKAKQR